MVLVSAAAGVAVVVAHTIAESHLRGGAPIWEHMTGDKVNRASIACLTGCAAAYAVQKRDPTAGVIALFSMATLTHLHSIKDHQDPSELLALVNQYKDGQHSVSQILSEVSFATIQKYKLNSLLKDRFLTQTNNLMPAEKQVEFESTFQNQSFLQILSVFSPEIIQKHGLTVLAKDSFLTKKFLSEIRADPIGFLKYLLKAERQDREFYKECISVSTDQQQNTWEKLLEICSTLMAAEGGKKEQLELNIKNSQSGFVQPTSLEEANQAAQKSYEDIEEACKKWVFELFPSAPAVSSQAFACG